MPRPNVLPVRRWTALAVLLALVTLGAAATALAVSAARAEAGRRDQQALDLVTTGVSLRLQQVVSSLRGIDGIASDGHVTADEFARFAADVLPESLLSALAYEQVIANNERATWEQETGRPIVDTDGQGGFAPSPQRPRYLPVRLVSPETTATKALVGFDIASDPVRRRGAERAEALSEPVVVGPINLANSAAPGLFLIHSVADSHGTVIGFVASGFATTGLLDGLAGTIDVASVGVTIDGQTLIGTRHGGPRRSFAVGNTTFVVDAGARTPTAWSLPAAVAAATAVLTCAVLLAERTDRQHRRRRAIVLGRQEMGAALGRHLAGAGTVGEVIAVAVQHLAAVVGANSVEIAHVDSVDPRRLLVFSGPVGDRATSQQTELARDSSANLARAVAEGEQISVLAGAANRRRSPEPGAQPGAVESSLCIPLRLSSGPAYGAVATTWTRPLPGAELDELLPVAETAAELVGRALERALLAAVVEERAVRLSVFAQALAVATRPEEVDHAVSHLLPHVIDAVSSHIRAAGAPAEDDETVYALRTPDAPQELAVRWPARRISSPTLVAVLRTIVGMVDAAVARSQQHASEHELVEGLQRALLRPPAPHPQLDIAARYEPAMSAVGIGGDWYDVIHATDGTVGIVLGDVTGHGTEAVTVMAELQILIRHLLASGVALDEVLRHADICLAPYDTYASVIIARLDLAAATLTIANAGHLPLLVRRGADAQWINAGRRPLLGVTGRAEYEPAIVPFTVGDLLVLFTDGLIEDRQASIDVGLDHVMAAADNQAVETAADMVEALLLLRTQAWRAHPTDDDAAVIALRRTETDGDDDHRRSSRATGDRRSTLPSR